MIAVLYQRASIARVSRREAWGVGYLETDGGLLLSA